MRIRGGIRTCSTNAFVIMGLSIGMRIFKGDYHAFLITLSETEFNFQINTK